MEVRMPIALRRVALCAAPLMLAWGLATAPVRAQDATPPAQIQSQPSTEQKLPEGQIEQLVAPIALYPDPLLTQVLMASTYPLEVVEAARWSQDNPSVKGQTLQDAMQAQSWDPSVKALTAVPQTLQMMSDKLDWTQQLGDAFLAQQQDVLDAVQTLRAEAKAAGNLQSTPEQTVTTAPTPVDVADSGAQQPIVIQPINPDVYYVPVYNPSVAYGTWNYPTYPPFYWSPPGFVASNVISFAAGVAVGSAIWGGCDWWNHNVIININRYNVFNRTNINIANNNIWTHNPEHRGNVPYRNAAVAERYGRANEAAAREAFRDRFDAEHPDASRPMGGDTGRVARDAVPAFSRRASTDVAPDRKADPARRDVDRQFDRATSERRDFAPPRVNARPQALRSRARVFRPTARATGGGHLRVGGFHAGGGRRRL
jgi:hypothetical protein